MGSGLVVLTLKLYRQLVLVSDSFVLDLYICCDFHPNHFLNFPVYFVLILQQKDVVIIVVINIIYDHFYHTPISGHQMFDASGIWNWICDHAIFGHTYNGHVNFITANSV